MCRKCYPIVTAQNGNQTANRAPLDEKWSIFDRLGRHLIVMVRHAHEAVVYAPLYSHRFQLVQPHTIVEAEKFNLRYADPGMIDCIPDKLRWYRYHKGLLQREVANRINISCNTYSGYEEQGRDYYPVEHMEKLAEVYSVQITELLDDYTLFLYRGQDMQLKTLRTQRDITQSSLAKQLGVPLGTLKRWEQNRVRMSKSSWEKLRKLIK